MSKHSSLAIKVLAPCAVLGALAIPACTSSDSGGSGAGGSTNTAQGGGSGTVGGASSASGGSSASAGGATGVAGGGPVACKPVTQDLITDFTYVVPEAGTPVTNQVTFGNFYDNFSGGTTQYPEPIIVGDVTGNDWHITGTVSNWSGLGIWFQDGCTLVDASAYGGISFKIWGTIGGTGNILTMGVGTAANQIPYEWFVKYGVTANAPPAPNFGTCNPPTSNRYDGSCTQPTKALTVTTEPTTVTIPWTDFKGGKPVASPDPAKIVEIYWSFTWADTTPVKESYTVDIHIDDLTFIPKT